MDSEESMVIKIKQELHEDITCEDNEDALVDASVSNGSVKLEDKVKKELHEEFGNESDDNTEYLCEQCKTYFPYLCSLQLHMQNNDNCDEKIDVKSPKNSLNFDAMQNAEVKEASKEGNYTEKVDIEQEEKCNDKKTKRKRQRTEERDDRIDSEKDEHESDKRELVDLIMKDHIILTKKHHDGIFDTSSFQIVKEGETEGINENNNDELVNLVIKDNIIIRTNNHAEKNIAMETEASEETSRGSKCEKSNVHAETSDGNNKMNNELCETRHDTMLNVTGDAYDDSCKENASKCSNNTKRTKAPVSKELGTQNIPPESSHMPNQFKASKKLKTHVSNSRKSGVSCDVCKKTFSRRDHLTRHVKRFHLKENTSPNQKYVCTLCDKSYETREKLKRHLNNAHKGPVFCDVCSKKFSRKDNLERHMKTVHLRIEETENHVCSFCDKSYENREKLKSHLYNAHRGPVFCDFCSKKFSRNAHLERHMKVAHLRTDVYECKFCKKKYFDENGLNRHTRIYCTKKKPITCKLCRYKYASQKKYEMHMVDHPRFICDYCDKMHYDRSSFQKHITCTHLNINVTKDVCKICSKKFKSQKTLELHMADHERFICDYCDKVFYRKCAFVVHIKRIHLKLRHCCKKCGNKYDYVYLKRHIKHCKGNIA